MGCSNIIPRTLFVSLSRLVTVECPSERVSGKSASDHRFTRFFHDRRYTMVAWCFFVHVLPTFKAPWGLERQPVG